MRLLLGFFILLCASSLQAQPFEKQMDAARTAIERRYNCECLKCLPAVTKPMQSSKDKNIIAQGYRDIAVLLWYCNDRFSNGYSNTLTAKGALRYSLMFRNSPDVHAMLDSMNKPEHDLYFSQNIWEWNKLDSPWQGKVLAAAPGGGAYLTEAGEAEGRMLSLKTDTGWISTGLSVEGWDKSGGLEFMRASSGKPAALLMQYGENSYGSGMGTIWSTAYLLELKSQQVIYTQSLHYEVEVFCGKYGEDPGCVRTPCAIEQPLTLKKNRIQIGKVKRTSYQEGEDCSLGGVSLSFIGMYGDMPHGFGEMKIPAEYILPGPPPGTYKLEKGRLVKE